MLPFNNHAMQLTPHFAMEEFLASELAARLSIDNTPPMDIVVKPGVTWIHNSNEAGGPVVA